jgi:hypothetical protein
MISNCTARWYDYEPLITVDGGRRAAPVGSLMSRRMVTGGSTLLVLLLVLLVPAFQYE